MPVRDLGIYFLTESEPVFRFHFDQLVGPARTSWSYYTDIDAFCFSQHERKIACFQIPYPYNNSIEKVIDQIYDSVDAIVILGSELHPRTVDFIRRYGREKINWFICGFLQPDTLDIKTFTFLDWFTTSVHFYKNVRPSTLYQLNPYAVKPLAFDALLGRKKPHRDQAYEFIQTHLADKGIITYVNDHQINFQANNDDQWIWESEGLEGQESVEWTVNMVTYYGYKMSLSQVIPINVYNQTAYSLVCETNFDNDYVFFTEKTVKPILARRLFILLSHRYALARLRDLGFRTFDGIIDESYDEIEPAMQRHEAALEQLRWLCNQDQSSILARCQEIVDYNFNLMYGKDWYNLIRFPLGRILLG